MTTTTDETIADHQVETVIVTASAAAAMDACKVEIAKKWAEIHEVFVRAGRISSDECLPRLPVIVGFRCKLLRHEDDSVEVMVTTCRVAKFEEGSRLTNGRQEFYTGRVLLKPPTSGQLYETAEVYLERM